MDAGEACHTPDCNLCHPKPIEHLYTYGMSHPSLCWYPDAPEPLSGENLAPLEKNQAYTTKAGTGVKRGGGVAEEEDRESSGVSFLGSEGEDD